MDDNVTKHQERRALEDVRGPRGRLVLSGCGRPHPKHRQLLLYASKLRCSLPAVKSLLNRAYTNLRVSLTEVGLTS